MTWVLVVAGAWLSIAAVVAFVIGRGIRIADQRMAAEPAGDAPNFTVDIATALDGAIAPAAEDHRSAPDAPAEQAMPSARTPATDPFVTSSGHAPAPHQTEQA